MLPCTSASFRTEDPGPLFDNTFSYPSVISTPMCRINIRWRVVTEKNFLKIFFSQLLLKYLNRFLT